MKKRTQPVLLGQKGARKSGLINQLKSLFEAGHMTLSLRDAKQLTRLVDRMVGRVSGKDKVSALRFLETKLGNLALSKKIISYSEAALTKRKSGFASIVKAGFRRGDRSLMARIELLDLAKKIETKKNA